jgi:hypothetical protein
VAWNKERDLALSAISRNPGDYAVGTAKGVARSIWDLNHIESEGLDLRAEPRSEGRAVPPQLTTWTWMASCRCASPGSSCHSAVPRFCLLIVGEERSRRPPPCCPYCSS